MDARGWLAVAAGKAAIIASRRLGHAGSNLPGEVARLVDPLVLVKVARGLGYDNVLITGTNGKTTTARMLAHIVELAGYDIAYNRAGANLLSGITSAYIESFAFRGQRGDQHDRGLGLAEVDEASMPRVAEELHPRAALVTNFFRDQLDRYGELDHTVDLVAKGLRAMASAGTVDSAVAVLNSDDPLVAGLARRIPRELKTILYGVDDAALGGPPEMRAADARNCVVCGAPYVYDVSYYAHLGHYRCPVCDHRRPEPSVAVLEAQGLGMAGWKLHLATPAGDIWVQLPLPGLFNVYNALAAVAGAYALGLPLAVVQQGLESFVTAFGRLERITIRGREVRVGLVKNPVAFNVILRMVVADAGDRFEAADGAVSLLGDMPFPQNIGATEIRLGQQEQAAARVREARRYLMIVINDRAADGRDVSWLWDVDCEQLASQEKEFAFVYCSGIRAEEMALRLKYAGFPMEKVAIERDLATALAAAVSRTPPGGRLWVLPTYTALLEVREIVRRWGFAPHFRER